MGRPESTLEGLLAACRPLAERFLAAGHTLYLVGGVVRDGLRTGQWGTGDDIDLTTDAPPDVVQRLVAPLAQAVWLQGKRFGTIGARVGGRDLEITTHRSEQYVSTSRKPVVAYSDDIVEDLSRRDFTINAMAVRLPDGELLDPFGGRSDLAAGVLRTPREPSVSFGDDPLRMLRAARFRAAFDVRPVPELAAAAREYAERLAIVSRERIRDELDRLLSLDRPGVGVAFLGEHGLLQQALPAVERAPSPVGELLDRMAHPDPGVRARARSVALLASLDVPEGTARPFEARVRSLRWPSARSATALAVARAAAELGSTRPWPDGALRRVLARPGFDLDLLTVWLDAEPVPGWTDVRDRMHRIRATEEVPFSVPITGADVMLALGVGEGPVVGRALAELHRIRLDEGPLERTQALEILAAWWRDRDG